ncbi:MAG: 50S ribosomal protein L9 [Candidatus Nanopelagicales bacterium]
MKLILTQEVDGLGAAGDIVDVKDGYGRNYLLPNGVAIAWTKGAEKQITQIKRAREAREIRGLEHANEVKQQIEALDIKLPVRAGEQGKLFGSVTVADIAGAIRSAGGPLVEKRSITLSKPIKTVGSHKVSIRLHPEVAVSAAVDVVPA